MRKLTRVKNLIIGLAMIVVALVLFQWPKFGTPMIMLIPGFGLLAYGIYSLVFYATMAVHMVGGKSIFYRGILLLDLGVFMLAAYRGAEKLIFLYLMVLLLASGGIDLVRALDFRKQGAAWKTRAFFGIVSILILIAGFVYRKNPDTMVYIFCLALLSSALNRIITAFRKTAVIYIPQ